MSVRSGGSGAGGDAGGAFRSAGGGSAGRGPGSGGASGVAARPGSGGAVGSAGRGSGAGGSRGGSAGAQGRVGGSGSYAGSDAHAKYKHRHRKKAQEFYAFGGREYQENPLLLDKIWHEDGQNYHISGRTCLSFGGITRYKELNWKEEDRDTYNGRCKFNRDCRVGDGPDHTDPKPARLRDRLDSRGNLVLRAKEEKVPESNLGPRYQHQDRYRDPHYHRAPQPPFKGVGGCRTPFWSPHVEVNLGFGHGVYEYQQARGPDGRVPHLQNGKTYEFTDYRRELVKKFNAPKVRSVIARQQTKEEATRDMVDQLAPEPDMAVSYVEFERYCADVSDFISDDGYFALLLYNEWR